ncbi:MAG: hypothetical protein PHX59_10280 [Sulfuricurvum sp.]|nr:hypothetical protein [Sulfuricurvum sp.]
MGKDEVLLLSLSCENYTSKILNGFFNVFILPLILFANVFIIIGIINYEDITNLASPFAVGVLSLLISSIYFVASVIFIFIFKQYSKLVITTETVSINSTDSYPIDDIQYLHTPSFSSLAKSFVLINKKTNKPIAHFNYRFGDTIFFENSPEMIRKVLQKGESEIKFLEQEIKEDREKVLKLKKLVKKIRIITMFSFMILAFLIILLLIFRDQHISNNYRDNIDMPPKIIYSDDILDNYILKAETHTK